MPNITDEKGKYALTCHSWSDYLEYCDTRKDIRGASSRNHSRTDRDNSYFSGVSSWPAALKLASNGWPEGVQQAKTLSANLVNYVSNLILRPDLVYDVEGTDFDVVLVCQNEPECWLKWIDSQQQITGGTQVVKLVFNGAASAGVSKETMIAKGSVIAALVELLEIAQRRVECTLVYGIRDYGDLATAVIRVPIKSAEQPLDLDRLTFSLAHPAAFRRLGFSCIEGFPKAYEYFGYGCPAETSDKDNPETLYIRSSLYPDIQWSNPSNATAWIKSQLLKQGVVLEGEL